MSELLDLCEKLPPARIAHHNLARAGSIYRTLGLPNPAKHILLCKEIADHWEAISAAASKPLFSLSAPTPSPVGRAVNPAVLIGEMANHRARARSGKRYSLFADIARFYPSVYTHSIPWALHTKAVSKITKGPTLLGNRLDKLIRDSQDGQTIGIPIGPDTSLVIAELILCAIDGIIADNVTRSGYRYLDDYELTFTTAADANAALGPLQEALGRYELALNANKTNVDSLPLPSEEPWLSELRRFSLRTKAVPQKHDLIDYFDKAFALARAFPTKTVLNYAVARLRYVEIESENASLAQDLILQSLVNETGVARFALEMLIRYRAIGMQLDLGKVSAAISTIVQHHSPLLNGSEVAWALWGAIAFDTKLDDSDAQAAIRMDDPIVTVLLMDAHSRGLIDLDVADQFAQISGIDSYRSERWLPIYEAVRRGWLLEEQLVEDDDEFAPFFAALREYEVVFYDSDVELQKINRPADELTTLELPVLGFVFGY
jgi:hypothetical protein